MCLVLQHQGDRLEVRGRLAEIIAYLAAHQEDLGVDATDNGQLHVSWSASNLKGWAERYLPTQRYTS